MKKTLGLTASLFALALAGGALSVPASADTHGQPAAQSGQASGQAGEMNVKGLRELDDDNRTAAWNGLSIDELDDLAVYNAAGEEVGEVEDVLGDSEGNIRAFVLEVGGFLGIGDEDVVISEDRAKLGTDRAGLIVDMTVEEMKTLPRWED